MYDSPSHLPEPLPCVPRSLNVCWINLGMNECTKNKCTNVLCPCPLPTLEPILLFCSLSLTTEEERIFYLHSLLSLSKVTCTPVRNHPATFETRLLSLFSLVEISTLLLFPTNSSGKTEQNSS